MTNDSAKVYLSPVLQQILFDKNLKFLRVLNYANFLHCFCSKNPEVICRETMIKIIKFHEKKYSYLLNPSLVKGFKGTQLWIHNMQLEFKLKIHIHVMKYATTISTIFVIYVSLSILSMFMFILTGHSGQFYLPVLIN